jgi:hypothetical protein
MGDHQLIALMAAILEAGDRAAYGREYLRGNARSEEPIDYAERARELLVAAEHANEREVVARPNVHRRKTAEEQAAHLEQTNRYNDIRRREIDGEPVSPEELDFAREWES